MAQFYHRFSTLMLGCWAFFRHLTFGTVSLKRVLRTIRRTVDYVVSATALYVTPDKSVWRVVERMCSKNAREKINIFGHHPCGTGALCSPHL